MNDYVVSIGCVPVFATVHAYVYAFMSKLMCLDVLRMCVSVFSLHVCMYVCMYMRL
jgi:hypothetical protein